MPSRYNSATLPYTSRSREHIYPVYAVKLLAPAILLRSLMSMPLVFSRGWAGRSGSTKVDAKMGMRRVRHGPSVCRWLLSLLLCVLVTTQWVKVKGWMCQSAE